MATSRGRTPRWTAEELHFVAQMVGRASNREIADELGRTKDSVACVISKHKLRSEPNPGVIYFRGNWSTKQERLNRVERMMQLSARCA